MLSVQSGRNRSKRNILHSQMGLFRRLLNRRRPRVESRDPQSSHEHGKSSATVINNEKTSIPNAYASEAYNIDAISVASFESGDEEAHDDEPTSEATTSYNPSSVYEKYELNKSEFRLLSLHPAKSKMDDIHCTMFKSTFKEYPEQKPWYKALSYTWGDATIRRIIFVNGHLFSITLNLYNALRYLRDSTHHKLLWIDAICINQMDLEEKTHQVGMMKTIYSTAYQVLVWLGESDKDIRLAMALFKHAEGKSSDGLSNFLTSMDQSSPFWTALDKFFRKPWWSRVWVAQEIIVANKPPPLGSSRGWVDKPPLIGCGRKWASWIAVRVAMFDLGNRQLERGGFLSNPLAIVQFGLMARAYASSDGEHEEDRQRWSRLDNLFNATSNRDTSQPHDKVFALLGIANSGASKDVRVDYSLPYSVTYQQAMVHVLKSSSDLSFLVSVVHPRAQNTVPSWCVDFSVLNWNDYSDACGLWSMPGKLVTGASGTQSKSKILHDPDEGTLEVWGNIVGRVQHVNASTCGSFPNLKLKKSRYVDTIMAAVPKAMHESLRSHLLRCVLADVMAFHRLAQTALEKRYDKDVALGLLAMGLIWQTVANLYSFEDFCEGWPDHWRTTMPNPYAVLESYAHEQDQDYRISAQPWSHLHKPILPGNDIRKWAENAIFILGFQLLDESLFTTDTGYFAKAPSAINMIREGDLLCIIHGCSHPVILRPQGQLYSVVTFSRVKDLMDGEFFDGTERQIQKFTLC